MRKRLLSLLLAFGLVSGSLALAPAQTVKAQESSADSELSIGDIHVQAKEFASDDVPDAYTPKSRKSRVGASNSAKRDTYWDQFSGHVYYDQLDSAERSLYDKLKALADSYLTGNTSATSRTTSDGAQGYYTDTVEYTGMTATEAFQVTTIFCFENPQFYFLNDGIAYTEPVDSYFFDYHEPGTVSLGVYSKYASASSRKSYTEQYKSAIDSYISGASQYKSDLAKETYFHDTLASTISYNQSTTDYNEDSTESQSASSAFLLKNTVCAGFTKAFSLLLNSQGIENVGITRNTHAWNEVNINGTWYVTDVTWDQNRWPSHDYFNISESELRSEDQMTSYNSNIFFWSRSSSEWVHTPLDYYASIRPVCSTDHSSAVDAVDLNDVTQKTSYQPSGNTSENTSTGNTSDNSSTGNTSDNNGNTNAGHTNSSGSENTSGDNTGNTSGGSTSGNGDNNGTSPVVTPETKEIEKKQPVKPDYFKVKRVKKGTLRLTIRTSSKVTGYYVYYRQKGDTLWSTKYVKVNGKSKAFNISGLSKGKTYQLRAYSVNSAGTQSKPTKTRTVKA